MDKEEKYRNIYKLLQAFEEANPNHKNANMQELKHAGLPDLMYGEVIIQSYLYKICPLLSMEYWLTLTNKRLIFHCDNKYRNIIKEVRVGAIEGVNIYYGTLFKKLQIAAGVVLWLIGLILLIICDIKALVILTLAIGIWLGISGIQEEVLVQLHMAGGSIYSITKVSESKGIFGIFYRTGVHAEQMAEELGKKIGEVRQAQQKID